MSQFFCNNNFIMGRTVMNFFVTYDYASELSGIEQAQKKRAKAFQMFGENIKLVSLAYNRFLFKICNQNGIRHNQLINMYDYFQGLVAKKIDEIPTKNVSDLIQGDEYVLTRNTDKLEIYNGQDHIKNIYLIVDGVKNDAIDKVEYFDKFNNLIRVDYFDIRGFLSMSDIIGQRGGVSREINYDLKGNSVLESYYHTDSQGKIQIHWMLNHDSNIYYFDNKGALESKFLDLISNVYGENNIFISDRAYATDRGLINMKSARKLFIFWHNVFVPDNGRPNITKPFDTLINQINNSNRIDGLLAATDKEVEDLTTTTKNHLKVYKLNSFIKFPKEIEKNRLDNDEKKEYDIITIARISPEKRILLGIEIFANLHEILPKIHWDIFGYGEQKYINKLQNIIFNKNLSDFIKIHSYKNDVAYIYRNAKLFWMLSKFEGFNMSQAEGQSYGLPTIAFDIDYGPSELIINNKNGVLVPNNDTVSFYKETLKLLKNPTVLSEMSSNAYLESDKYSPEFFWNQWSRIINNWEN